MQINPRNGRFYAVFRGFLHPAGVCRARRAAAVVGRSWASWARKRTPTAADAHNLKIVVKLRAVPASKVPFPVGIAGFPDFSRPVPVYPAFLKYVVPVHIQGKGCCVMSQVALDGLDIVPSLQESHCVAVAQVMKPCVRHTDIIGDALEVVVRGAGRQVSTHSVAKHIEMVCQRMGERF